MRIVLALSLLAFAARARADGPYEGQWREGPLSIDVSVESWGGDCGPQPRSTTSGGGGTFRISQEGDQLTFHMRHQQSTQSCWSENRAVRRVSSSYSAGTWHVICRTPADDSRSETGNYSLQALGNDRLQFRDVSQYDWQLNTSRCRATITTTQSFSRASASTQPENPQHPQPQAPARCTAGPPARITLRPARTDVEPGGEACFTARAVDAQGCATSSHVTLALASGSGEMHGNCYRAPSGEAEAHVRATLGSLSAEAVVSVHTFDLSDLIARRTETGSVGGAPDDGDASGSTAARVSARAPEPSDMSSIWLIAIVAGVVLVLGLGALLLVGRRKPKRRPAALVEEPELAPAAREPKAPASTPPPPGGGDLICPKCRRGYPPGTSSCKVDGTALIPYTEFLAQSEGTHVCPVCGERYPAHVRFCGKDGATLGPSAE